MLADMLFRTLERASSNMTDGTHNYNGAKKHVLGPVHRTRTKLRRDPKFRQMKKELTESGKEVAEAENDGEMTMTIERRKEKMRRSRSMPRRSIRAS